MFGVDGKVSLFFVHSSLYIVCGGKAQGFVVWCGGLEGRYLSLVDRTALLWWLLEANSSP